MTRLPFVSSDRTVSVKFERLEVDLRRIVEQGLQELSSSVTFLNSKDYASLAVVIKTLLKKCSNKIILLTLFRVATDRKSL